MAVVVVVVAAVVVVVVVVAIYLVMVIQPQERLGAHLFALLHFQVRSHRPPSVRDDKKERGLLHLPPLRTYGSVRTEANVWYERKEPYVCIARPSGGGGKVSTIACVCHTNVVNELCVLLELSESTLESAGTTKVLQSYS